MCMHLLDLSSLCQQWMACGCCRCLIDRGRICTWINARCAAHPIRGTVLVSEVVWKALVLMLNNKDLFPICKKLLYWIKEYTFLNFKGFFLHPLPSVPLSFIVSDTFCLSQELTEKIANIYQHKLPPVFSYIVITLCGHIVMVWFISSTYIT